MLYSFKNVESFWILWRKPVILALQGLRLEDQEFHISLVYTHETVCERRKERKKK